MQHKKITVVEDDQHIRDIIDILLTSESYEVILCANAAEFHDSLSHLLPDLFILDMMLPDGNGIGLCQELRSDIATVSIPIMVMSANVHALKALECGANVFVQKPFDIQTFVQHVKSLL
ncbi:response regulator [Niabella yanshanensis]|uniref:Response regulator n=1 Tax=Niabella yanshanensis TaxID=577386 RepID=A0ABZ0W803_9BACT|nr:response regulator [Niabella yanshanensis]WQD38622.1 response regulator [Niabella yanshanensis]